MNNLRRDRAHDQIADRTHSPRAHDDALASQFVRAPRNRVGDVSDEHFIGVLHARVLEDLLRALKNLLTVLTL